MHRIAAAVPAVNVERVAAAVERQFGLAGDYLSLVSERDQNFRLTTASGERYVVKVVCSGDSDLVNDFQIEALRHLQRKHFQDVPRVVTGLSGAGVGKVLDSNGLAYRLRVVTWVEGELWLGIEPTTLSAASLGRRLAELNVALVEFRHPGEEQDLPWDMQKAGRLTEYVGHIDDPDTLRLVRSVLSDFEGRVSAKLPSLPQQIIHNDANGGNVLYDKRGEVCGIIDFGDMILAPRIVEVATAASYLRCVAEPERFIRPFVDAYHSVSPLSEDEFDVLHDLVKVRLSMTITFLYWRLAAVPEDDPYREKTLHEESGATEFLAAFAAQEVQ